MPETQLTVCPYLGVSGERTVARTAPDRVHRCYAQRPPGQPDLMHQAAYCLSANHGNCPVYRRAVETSPPEEPEHYEPPDETRAGPFPWGRLALIAIPALLLLAVAGFYLRDMFRAPPPVVVATPTTIAQPDATPTVTPGPVAEQPQPVAVVAVPDRLDPPTAEPGGQVVVAQPAQSEVGWWTGAEPEGSHISDSYLYAGFYEGDAFISAIRFDLSEAQRGAAVLAASLRLTGLLSERFDPAAGGTWTVQLIPGSALPSFQRVDFQTLLNTPAAVTLFPTLYPADLVVGQVNVLNLDQSALAWLQERITQGDSQVIARIVGPGGGGDTLFAWDSGFGPATSGAPPQFVVSLGSPPPTVPPLPTGVFAVATLTPTPGNILTAAANALAATEVAAASALTPQLPIFTPTPAPENIATMQAARFIAGLPPLVVYTLTPANEATAAAYAAEATAVAVTTGTFTPVPMNAVTPVLVLPTPIPANAATAAAQMIAATEQARTVGTITPLPRDALIATRTATPVVIVRTATPENRQTAEVISMMATAVAVTTGTYTPLPPNAITATPSPFPTVTPGPPLIVFLDQVTPSPTPTGESGMPAILRGKVVFISDRDGVRTFLVVDPANGRQAYLTREWPYTMAQRAQLTSPDGRFTLSVGADEMAYPQIFVRDNASGQRRKLTSMRGGAFDPAYSPAGDRIVFSSWEAGNEEVYVMNPDGTNIVRLTDHPDVDRHPSYSPNGAQIVWWSQRDTGRRQLWIMNADGSNQRQLLSTQYDDYDPFWVR